MPGRFQGCSSSDCGSWKDSSSSDNNIETDEKCRQETGSSSRSSTSPERLQLLNRRIAVINNSKERRMREIAQFKEEVARYEAITAFRRMCGQQQTQRRFVHRNSDPRSIAPKILKELTPSGRYSPSGAPTPSPPPYRRQPFAKQRERGDLTPIRLLKFKGRKYYKNPSDEYVDYFAARSPARTVLHRVATTQATQTTDYLEALAPSDRAVLPVPEPKWFSK